MALAVLSLAMSATASAKRKALTGARGALYHGRMTRRPWLLGSTVLLAAGVCGCEDAGRKPVQAHVPALVQGKTAAAHTETTLPQLPLRNSLAKPLASLLPPVPGGKEYLIAQVEGKFASGEQNYKAGHLEAARRDFDDGVDWMWESGSAPTSHDTLTNA